MTKIYYGCDEIPRNWGTYSSLCNAIELNLEQLDNPPKDETLNRWRVESPRGFAFILHADPSVAQGLAEAAQADKTELPDSVLQGWQKTVKRAQALAAKAIIIKTPISFSPGIAGRALIEAVGAQLVTSYSNPVIWEAQGMWDTENSRGWANDLGLTYAFDPYLALREELGLMQGDGAFILNERGGLRREFDRFDIRAILDELGSYNRAFFMLRGRFKWNHASLFRELLADDD